MQIQMKFHRFFSWIFIYFLEAEFSRFIKRLDKILKLKCICWLNSLWIRLLHQGPKRFQRDNKLEKFLNGGNTSGNHSEHTGGTLGCNFELEGWILSCKMKWTKPLENSTLKLQIFCLKPRNLQCTGPSLLIYSPFEAIQVVYGTVYNWVES